jgi:hypothetical protein
MLHLLACLDCALIVALISAFDLFSCFRYCVTGELAPPANPLICPQFWSVHASASLGACGVGCLLVLTDALCSVVVFALFSSLRFNDLDNIGLTGRHYSGFIMLGIQVFNSALLNPQCASPTAHWRGHNFACFLLLISICVFFCRRSSRLVQSPTSTSCGWTNALSSTTVG